MAGERPSVVGDAGDREHTILPGANLNDAQPVHACIAQMGHQVEIRVFGDPGWAAGQRGQFVYGGRAGAPPSRLRRH
jgi:hypothetical protein